jgi:phosphoribosylaminoimidazole carboxylase (NCAIR synthetase)
MTKHKIIHIIGGGYNQLPLVKVAHDLGLKVLITDSHENCPCRAEADIFERVDMTDKNATLKTAMAANIDAIVADQVDAAPHMWQSIWA